MIKLTVPNINPHIEFGTSFKKATTLTRVTERPVLIDFCFCDFECDWFEYAFFDQTNDWYKNDKTSFIVQLNDSQGSYEAVLIRGNDEHPITSDVATMFDFGDRKGALIDWKKVSEIHGNGDYIIKITINEFTQEISKESHKYRVMPFVEEVADRTIKLESYNTGVIKNGFDYRGLRWYQSIRLYGDFKLKPVLQSENFEDSDRKIQNIQSSIREEIAMELDRMPSSVFRQLWNNDLLATEKRISNYKVFAFEQYRRVDVILKAMDDPDYSIDKRTAKQNILFDKKDVILKQYPQR